MILIFLNPRLFIVVGFALESSSPRPLGPYLSRSSGARIQGALIYYCKTLCRWYLVAGTAIFWKYRAILVLDGLADIWNGLRLALFHVTAVTIPAGYIFIYTIIAADQLGEPHIP